MTLRLSRPELQKKLEEVDSEINSDLAAKRFAYQHHPSTTNGNALERAALKAEAMDLLMMRLSMAFNLDYEYMRRFRFRKLAEQKES